MGAARAEFLRRSMVAGLASTVVISLTALTAGVAPAVADPEVVTTTAEAPQPSGGEGRDSSGESTTAETAVTSAPVVTEAPVVTQAPAATEAPVVTEAPVATEAPAVTEAPVATQAPVTEAPVETPAPVPTVTQAPAPKPTTAPTVEKPAVVQPTTTTTKRPGTPVTTPPATPPAEPEAAPSSAAPTTATAEPSPEPRVGTGRTTTSAAAPAATDAPETANAPETASEPETTNAPEATEDTATGEPSAVEPVARVIETLKPEVLDAPAADVVLASNTTPVEVNPEPAKVQELVQLSALIGVSDERDRLREEGRELREDQRQLRDDQRQLRDDQRELRAEQRDWDRRVRQWSPDWVQYDEFYRPVIVNPYRDPVRIVYEYQDRPRVVTIPPLQRMVMYVADLAAYSFTAVVLNTINTVVSTAVGVAVGSFFGGGFIPTIANIGAIAPPPPPPLFRYDNVPVQVRYSDAVYEPFRVQRIVDVGDDARYGERRVLLDGVTPAWGVWKQNAAGERQFEVHRTQQYPGLDTPREGPLPGDYRMTLASEEAPASAGGQTGLIIAAVACAVLSLGAVGAAGLLGRRRRV